MSSPLVPSFDTKKFFTAVRCDGKVTFFRKNQVVFSQGDRSDALFYVESGAVKLTVVSKAGKEAIVYVADGGSFFGESCISLDTVLRLQSAVALTNVHVVKIEASRVKQFITNGGNTALSFVSLIIAQNMGRQTDLACQMVESSEENLARVVASFVHFTKSGRTVRPKISQQTLAEMIGISRQHVNALLKRSRKGESPIATKSASASTASGSPIELDSGVVQRREKQRA